MSVIEARKAFEKACPDSDLFNPDGLPRISDAEHLKRALMSGRPHLYIAERAGCMTFNGEDGLGFYNAVTLHQEVIAKELPVGSDIKSLLFHTAVSENGKAISNVSFHSALEGYGIDKLPFSYKEAIGANMLRQLKSESHKQRYGR